MNEIPHCPSCQRALTRIDHYGIEHLILDANLYRPVSVVDLDELGQSGLASETDLRCGFCGASVPREVREFFYRRWYAALQFTGQYTAESREQWRAEISEAKRTMTKEEFSAWLIRRTNSAAK